MSSRDLLINNSLPNVNEFSPDIEVDRSRMPQYNQNCSESSNPTKYQQHLHLMLQDGQSFMSSSGFFDLETDHQSSSQNVQGPLDRATNYEMIVAFKDCKELKESEKRKKTALFTAQLKQAMVYNKNYQLDEASEAIKDATITKKQAKIELNELTAHSFVLYYHVKGRVLLYRQFSKESFVECLEAFTEAANIVKQYFKQDSRCLSHIRNDIAKLHYTSREGDYQVAEDLLRKSLRYSQANNDIEHKTLCYVQLTELYLIKRDLNQIRENLRLCREAAHQISKRKLQQFFLARNKRNLGYLHFISAGEIEGEGCYQTAIRSLRKIFPQMNKLTQLYSHELIEFRALPGASEVSLGLE